MILGNSLAYHLFQGFLLRGNAVAADIRGVYCLFATSYYAIFLILRLIIKITFDIENLYVKLN